MGWLLCFLLGQFYTGGRVVVVVATVAVDDGRAKDAEDHVDDVSMPQTAVHAPSSLTTAPSTTGPTMAQEAEF